MEQSVTDLIWNRAALENGGATPRQGDRLLAALLLAHGFIVNGGVHHGLECLSPAQLEAARDAYTYFGFGSVVSVLDAAPRLEEDEADAEYGRLIPSDATIDRRFLELYARSPQLFAPTG